MLASDDRNYNGQQKNVRCVTEVSPHLIVGAFFICTKKPPEGDFFFC